MVMSLFTMLALASAYGQSMSVNVPFEFSAAGKVHAAGQYAFRSNDNLLTMHNVKERNSVGFRYRRTGYVATDSTLLFSTIQGQHVLSGIRMEDQEGWLITPVQARHTSTAIAAVPRALATQ